MTPMITEETPIVEEVWQARVSDGDWQDAGRTIGFPVFLVAHNRYNVLVKQAPVQRALYNYIPVALCICILYFSDYPALTNHTRDQPLHSMNYYVLVFHMASDVYTWQWRFLFQALKGIPTNHKRKLHVFPEEGPLGVCETFYFGTTTKNQWGNHQIIILTENYLKIIRITPIAKITLTHLANIFLYNWVVQLGLSSSLLTHDGLEFVRKVFGTTTPDPSASTTIGLMETAVSSPTLTAPDQYIRYLNKKVVQEPKIYVGYYIFEIPHNMQFWFQC